MKEREIKERKMIRYTDSLGVVHRVSEVERINDGLFLLDLEIVVIEIAQDLLLDLHVVKNKQ
jgi:hypothetical protein